jgi:hypothetical protein
LTRVNDVLAHDFQFRVNDVVAFTTYGRKEISYDFFYPCKTKGKSPAIKTKEDEMKRRKRIFSLSNG